MTKKNENDQNEKMKMIKNENHKQNENEKNNENHKK